MGDTADEKQQLMIWGPLRNYSIELMSVAFHLFFPRYLFYPSKIISYTEGKNWMRVTRVQVSGNRFKGINMSKISHIKVCLRTIHFHISVVFFFNRPIDFENYSRGNNEIQN